MYIQNATYKAVPTAGLTFPLAEGTVLTVGDVTGIVPENISLAAPTGLIYLAVGGTIDLTSEANAGVTFTDEQLNELGGDFNFIPMTEAGGSSLPSYTSADIGKVLTVGEASETVQTVIIPEQTVTISDASGAALTIAEGQNLPTVGDAVVATLNGETIQTTVIDDGDPIVVLSESTGLVITLEQGGAFLGANSTSADGTYTVSLTASAPKAEPKWGNAGGGMVLNVNLTENQDTNEWEVDKTFDQIKTACQSGVCILVDNYAAANALLHYYQGDDENPEECYCAYLYTEQGQTAALVRKLVSIFAEEIDVNTEKYSITPITEGGAA